MGDECAWTRGSASSWVEEAQGLDWASSEAYAEGRAGEVIASPASPATAAARGGSHPLTSHNPIHGPHVHSSRS